MDTFFQRLGLIVIVLCALIPQMAEAETIYSSPDAAMAACHATIDAYVAGGQPILDAYCYFNPANPVGLKDGYASVGGHTGVSGRSFHWKMAVPYNPCQGMASTKIYQSGKILNGSKSCIRGNVQPDGSQAMCGVNVNPVSPPTWNPYSGGGWETYISVTPTGTICGLGGGDNPGAITGPAGDTGPKGPPIPDPVPPPDNDPPDLCGGVSCYDPSTGDTCAVVDGQQMCVNTGVPGGDGSSGGGSGGGCTSKGDKTLCAGSPSAPPPSPDAVPDPPGQTQGSDTRTHANPTTGGSYTTVTTTYGNPGQTGTSGQGPGDSGPPQASGGGGGGDPAPSTSTGGGGSLSGGQDCNNPPACSGDVVLCGVVKQQWLTMCSAKKSADLARKDLVGDGTAPTTEPAKTAADVWQDGDAGYVGDATGAAANTGVYDQSGFGAPTACPLVDLEVPLWDGRSFSIPFSNGCDLLGWIRALVIAFALFAAVRITMGGLG